jgi:ATP-dependent Clp protease ATP-binding subunit ClpA
VRKQYRVPESVDIPIANEYKEVVLQAADEARMLISSNIGPQHLLLAILRMKECLAANILVNIGLTYDTLREALRKNVTTGVPNTLNQSGEAPANQITGVAISPACFA